MRQTEYEAVLSKRCRIKAVMMVETDIIVSIKASLKEFEG
jgi:hypothetical protein